MIGHVLHNITGLRGQIRGRAERLHDWDVEGPWFYVEWDDGLTCWVPQSQTTRDDALSFR